MSDARDVIGKTIFVQRGISRHGSWADYKAWAQRQKIEPDFLADADAILSALSAMPLASRLALARALVPGWAVVPREVTEEMLVAGAARHRDFLSNQGPYPRTRAVWTAMLTAAEKPPHGP